MRWSWRLGRLAGIDVFLHPTLLIVFLMALASGGDPAWSLALTAALFGCVLLHEFGHALAARAFGIDTVDITLYPIGGVARLERMPRAPGVELLVALAGPAVNVAIGGALAALLWLGGGLEAAVGPEPLVEFLHALMWVNVGLALFNLLPFFPMDGGRVLRAALAGPLGRARATDVAATIGQAAALIFGVLFLINGLVMQAVLAGFLFVAAGAERRQVAAEERRRSYGPATSWPTEGIWTAPPGYRWVSRGQGTWQLAPIVVPAYDPRPPHRGARPWL